MIVGKLIIIKHKKDVQDFTNIKIHQLYNVFLLYIANRLKSNEISVTLILKICKMYPVAINNLVKLACASYLISMSKADTLTFVYKDFVYLSL